jgi:hypothetical protein
MSDRNLPFVLIHNYVQCTSSASSFSPPGRGDSCSTFFVYSLPFIFSVRTYHLFSRFLVTHFCEMRFSNYESCLEDSSLMGYDAMSIGM